MLRWKPQLGPGRWIALALLLVMVCGIVAVGWQLAPMFRGSPENWQIDLGTYGRVLVLLALVWLAGALAYRTAAAFTLSYELDRNGLYILWLGNRAVVPLDLVQNIDIGIAPAYVPWRPLQGIGYHWGQGRIDDGRRLHQFSTRPPDQSLVIYTPEEVYSISPADREAFVQDLEQRRNLGATKPLASTFEPSRMFLYEFWNDATVRRLLLIALALNLLMLGLLAARYPALEPLVRMRFDAAGQVSDLRPRHQVLFLPLAATSLSLINMIIGLVFYRAQQLGARLLQGASVVVQILFGIAMLTIIR
ncbi:MAG: PH domain-containing protein [Kouleothrix sp.]|jgi:uncharacterized membrane protein (DUF485 family)|nr:PH domain-containing protein [Kouleothrix sp.]